MGTAKPKEEAEDKRRYLRTEKEDGKGQVSVSRNQRETGREMCMCSLS